MKFLFECSDYINGIQRFPWICWYIFRMTSRISGALTRKRFFVCSSISRGMPWSASAIGPAMAARVSASPPKGDRIAHRIFETIRFQRAGDGLRHGFLTSFVKTVTRSNFVYSPGQVIAVFGGDDFPDGHCVLALTGEPDGVRRGSRAFDAFGVIVGDGRLLCRKQRVPHPGRPG